MNGVSPSAGSSGIDSPRIAVWTSPSTTRRDRGEKLRLYAESSVGEYWVVDPAARQVEFLVNEGGPDTSENNS